MHTTRDEFNLSQHLYFCVEAAITLGHVLLTSTTVKQCPGRLLGIIGQNPSVSKSNRLHVVIFRFFFIKFEVYSINSSKMMGNSPEALNYTQLFSQTQPVSL